MVFPSRCFCGLMKTCSLLKSRLTLWVFIEILNLKSMLLSVGGHRVLEGSPNIVPNSNLKIWNWYKLLTLWKVVLIDLYALLSNSLYTEHGSASLFFKIIIHKNFLFFSCLNFRFWQIYYVPEILCQCQWFMLGSKNTL